MNTLTVADLNIDIDVEPRVSHRHLAEALGMSASWKLRQLVERNISEFERYGVVSTTAVDTTNRGGRPGEILWLNEGQAILAAVRSSAPLAADVRYQVITAFMEYRRNQIPGAAGAHLLERLERVLDTDNRAKKLATAVAMIDDMCRRSETHTADMRMTSVAMRELLTSTPTNAGDSASPRHIVDAKSRHAVGIEMLASGRPPRDVARIVGVQEQTAKKWRKQISATSRI